MSRKRLRPSFQMIIDGCNGPIRFSEHQLKHAEEREWQDLVFMARPDKANNNTNKGSVQNQKNGKKKNSQIPSHEAYDTLDIIPLFQQLSKDPGSPFDSFSIIFDGVSRSKRPAQMCEAKASRRKEWSVDKTINIEITDLYDETDNIIVERVRKWSQEHQPKQDDDQMDNISRMLKKTALLDENEIEGEIQGDSSCVALTVKRSNMGPGKARAVLKTLGLFRPESVACLFTKGFSSPALEKNAKDTLTKKLNHSRVHQNLILFKQEKVFTFQDQRKSEDNDISMHCMYPVVVTDDVFLRQRIVSDGGLVFTFHQLWILLVELRATIDKEAG